jgi:hypothetical protein
LAVTLLGMAILLFRGSHSDIGEPQDTRSEVDAPLAADDGVPIPAFVVPALARRVATRLITENPSPLSGYLFVSEIFRPPIAPLSPISMFDQKKRERSRSCPVSPCGRSAIPFAPASYPSVRYS